MLSKPSTILHSIGLHKRSMLLTLISMMCIFIGLVASRAMVSIGMVGLIMTSLLQFKPTSVVNQLKHRRHYLLLCLHFLIVLLSALYSTNTHSSLVWLQLKLPFLFLPIAFVMLPRFSNRFFIATIYCYSCILLISASVVLCNYFLHRADMLYSIEHGGAITTPFSHIRFSLLLVLVFCFNLWLLNEKSFIATPNEKWWQLICLTTATIAIHILSVRSGLLAFYIGLVYFVLKWVTAERKWKLAFSVFILSATVLWGMLHFSASFQQRLSYMQYDVDRALHGEYAGGSDGMRLLSWQAGWEVFLENKWAGVGAGDIRVACEQWYMNHHPEITGESLRKVPHNQFLWVMVQAGLWGLFAFCFASFGLWCGGKRWKHPLFFLFHLLIFSSFLTEHTLEEQMGIAIYVVFSLLMMQTFFTESETVA